MRYNCKIVLAVLAVSCVLGGWGLSAEPGLFAPEKQAAPAPDGKAPALVPVLEYPPDRVRVYTRFDYFVWKEYEKDDAEDELLKESGTIYVVGVEGRIGKYAGYKGELFAGTVDYDGQLTDGTSFETHTEYQGFLLEGAFIYDWRLNERWGTSFRARLGYKAWERELRGKDGVEGYTEDWSMLYLLVGAEGNFTFRNEIQLFAGVALGSQLYVTNRVDEFDVTVHPEPGGMAELEGGIRWRNFFAKLSLTSAVFNESDVDNGMYQPHSETGTFGLTLGVSF